jgi:hypothetical protein
MHMALLFGQRSYGVIGCNDLWIEQGLDTVQNMIRQLRTPGYRKQLATIFLRIFQNASGLSQPLMRRPKIRAPHLEGHYYVHMRRFLAQHSASLEIDCISKPTYKRQVDGYIMDVVCSPNTAHEMDRNNLKHYKDTEIRQIYYCKSYLNVPWISDLCTADGDFVLPSIAKGERSIQQCASNLEGIRQERPSGTSWTIWRRFLSTICKQEQEQTSNGNPNENNTGEDEGDDKDKFSIGTKITKYWNGEPYIGSVNENTGKYYKIRYEDNDEEELNHTEVEKCKKKNRGEGRTTSEIGQRMRLRKRVGDWNKTAANSERIWPFYFSLNKETLYRSYREEWHRKGKNSIRLPY